MLKSHFLLLTSFVGVSLAQYPVVIIRPNGERAEIGPGPGCFGVQGPVYEVKVPYNQNVQFFSDYGCKGQCTYTGGSRVFQYNSPLVYSIQIYNQVYY
ncbi:hypothetical protein K502DRAFT_352545 [Neoconidiobolus thromboides FSU 785]|nr:hypothetical protein K502DRAFT_352545 [Neoconidiobolus thromboides FSU 785]